MDECKYCKITFNRILYFCEKYNIKSKKVYNLNLKQTCKLIELYELENFITDGLFSDVPPDLEHRLSNIKKVIDI